MCPKIKSIATLLDCGTQIISGSLIPVIVALAAMLFVWGVVKYFIIDAGEEAKRTQGKQFILWGIITFVVISSVWALINILGNTFGFSPYTRTLPGIEYPDKPFKLDPSTSTTSGTGTVCTCGYDCSREQQAECDANENPNAGGSGVFSCTVDTDCPRYDQFCGEDGYCH